MEGIFLATLPPLGWNSYLIQMSLHYTAPLLKSIPVKVGEPLFVDSRVYRIYFDADTGAMKRIVNKLAGLSGVHDSLTQRFMEYASSTGDEADTQPSG